MEFIPTPEIAHADNAVANELELTSSLSVVDRLPVELTSEIFDIYASNHRANPLVLGALVEDWLDRSGQLPLEIRLSIPNEVEDSPQVRRLIDIVNQHCGHWCVLDITFPPFLLVLLNDSACVSSTIIELIVTAPDCDFNIYTLSKIAPKYVNLEGPTVNLINFNWTNVTNLTLNSPAVHRLFELILSIPSLRKCRFYFVVLEDVPYPFHTSNGRVNHAGLESLEIIFLSTIASDIFFRTIAFPNLTHLFAAGARYELSVDGIAFFLAQEYSKGIKSLCFHETEFRPKDFLRLIRLASSVEELEIIVGEGGFQDFWEEVYYALKSHLPTTETPIPAVTEPLLPRLRIFKWSGLDSFLWKVVPWFLVPLSQDDESRRRPLETVEIICDYEKENPIPYIDEDVISQLAEFEDRVHFSFTIRYSNDQKEVLEDDLLILSREKLGGN
ncbi:hypothetical protein CPB84DRAFT_1828137 [Gymnopilus junonius]|uniref:Uncharacterized protein n=1 Tax=Gymnopilus junonius TaxID=109634 RepID=A0A9P5NDE4_GYMJU|nr:hypothetical protein CPB84DRAFT_1828137 [Gymnopilus junonius]